MPDASPADLECDVAIIGAGTAGLAAERAARAAGARTLLIDDRFAGTTCATVGCMPSKLLIAAGMAAADVRRAAVFGIKATPRVDGAAVMRRLRQVRDRFAAAARESAEELPEGAVVRGRAAFAGPTTLTLDDGRMIVARAIVIATGSKPVVPEPFRTLGDLVDTNETVFERPDLPSSLAVIGAGKLGLEIAQAFAQLGVDVAVFDNGEQAGGVSDPVINEELVRILRRDLDLHLGVDATPMLEDGRVTISWDGGRRRFDRILVATGRAPQVDGLHLDRAGLALDEHGVPCHDPHSMRCGDSAVFIAGDADGARPVLHEASEEGTIAGRNAACFPDVRTSERDIPFTITFTDPPFAMIGALADRDHVTACADYADQGRATVEARAEGKVRLYAARPGGRLTGAAMIGPGMDHIAHLLALAIMRGETASSLLELPFYHPTLEEGLKPALRAICAMVDTPLPERDEGTPAGA